MKIENQMKALLESSFFPVHLELINESDSHSGPPGRESHFKLVLVSEKFQGQNRVARSRSVYQLLGTFLSGPVHALAMHLYAPAEWADQSPDSPLCASKMPKG